MPDILTITLNPAVDISTSVQALVPAHKLRCAPSRRFAGGGGINVARVLQRLGADCQALVLCGGVVGQQLADLLALEQVPNHRLRVAGETRECFSVRESASGKEYRFVLPGPTVSGPEWQQCIAYLQALRPVPRYLVLSGSLPPGVPDDAYAVLSELGQQLGCRVMLDSSGPALAHALAKGVYLVKPSLRELADLTGHTLDGETQWQAAALRLVHSGSARVVALSLGAQGAMLVTRDGSWRADALNVPVASTAGAGDSFLAAIVWSLAREADALTAFRLGVAAGSAALLSEGTALCSRADIERLLPMINPRPVAQR